MIFTGYTITHGTLTIMLYLGTLDGLTQDIPTNWILICIWLMFSYLIEVCGFWLEKKHTHTIHGTIGTVWLHCFCTKMFLFIEDGVLGNPTTQFSKRKFRIVIRFF